MRSALAILVVLALGVPAAAQGPAPSNSVAGEVAPKPPLKLTDEQKKQVAQAINGQDTLDKLDGGDQKGATARIRDLETAWDKAEATLKPKDPAAWTKIDDKIDEALRQLRSVNPNTATEKTALQDLLSVLT